MVMTLLQMVEKILEEEKRALTAWEIWQSAETKGYDKLIDSDGERPSVPLSTLIYTDIIENPSSVFISLNERPPKRFILKNQIESIRPGKKVRVFGHFHAVVDDFTHITQVFATKDSICVILSYEEYSAYADRIHDSDSEQRSKIEAPLIRHLMDDSHVRHLAWVKSGMIAGIHYPVRFEKFVPLPEIDYAMLQRSFDIIDIVCHDAAVVILPTYTFVIPGRLM
jgi:hypothetical protein